MKIKVAVIGGGITGAATAYYLSQLPGNENLRVTLFDSGKGQATKAAAGIISPWLSKRRNRQWYHLACAGAALLARLANKINLPDDVYSRSGMIITRKSPEQVSAVTQMAKQRVKAAPTIGKITRLTASEVRQRIPMLDHSLPGVMISGGAQVNGGRLANVMLRQPKPGT